MKSKLPILLYHDLESPEYPSEKADPAARGTVVDSANFDAQLRWLSVNGYQTISLSEYFKLKDERKPLPLKIIIITFDDCHSSNYRLAFPILKNYEFKATFFIIADRVNSKDHLTEEHVRELQNSGMEFGSHGLSHAYLPLLNNNKIEHELKKSKQILESIIENSVDYFAFPGGHYNRNVLKKLSACGYTGACSCLQGLNDLTTKPFLLRRIEIRSRITTHDFSQLFNPLNLAFYRFIDLWKRTLARSIGLERYSKLRTGLYKYYIFKR